MDILHNLLQIVDMYIMGLLYNLYLIKWKWLNDLEQDN